MCVFCSRYQIFIGELLLQILTSSKLEVVWKKLVSPEQTNSDLIQFWLIHLLLSPLILSLAHQKFLEPSLMVWRTGQASARGN